MIPHDISEDEVKKFQGLVEYLKRLADDGITPLIERQVLAMLDNATPFFTHLVMVDTFHEFHRITINKNVLGENKRIRDIQYLKYPPADKISRYGRCNLPRQSVLYGSFMYLTTLSELKPRVGDLITHSIWRVKNNQSLTFCPIFKNQPTKEQVINPRTLNINRLYEKELKSFPNYARIQIDTLVQFIADAFTKRINPENHLDYVFSAHFANKILYEFTNGSIEAIYYPSVPSNLSFENIAIKPNVFDSKYDLVEVKDVIVIGDPSNGRGGYSMEGLGDCKSFDYAKGKILWDMSKIRQSRERVFEHKLNYGLELE